MREKIQEQLRRIEEAENIKILLAVESGSRAWGFASPDSDYDVRFIYIRRLEDYLRLGAIRDVIELPIDDVLDIKLNALVRKYVNLEYTLPNGEKVKFLDDQKTYLGNQMESEFGGDKCFGILASMDFILVCTYEKDGENPELFIYKKR